MNKFLVGAQGDDLVILAFARRLSKSDALNLAAHLVVLADPTFEAVGKPSTEFKPTTEFGRALAEALS